MKESAPFGIQEILGQLVFRLDIVLLSVLTTSVVVGEYGAGYRILEATLFLAWSVGTSVLPMYSYLGPADTPSLDRVFAGSIRFVCAIMTPLAVVLFMCASPIVDLLFGLPEFSSTVGIVRWLALAPIAYGIGHLAGILVLVRREGRYSVIAMAWVVAANLALNLALISAFEATGAAAATLATEVLLAVISLWLARAVVALPSPREAAAGPIVAGVAMALAMVPIADTLVLAVPIGIAVYLAVLMAVEPQTFRDARETLRAAAADAPTRPVVSVDRPVDP